MLARQYKPRDTEQCTESYKQLTVLLDDANADERPGIEPPGLFLAPGNHMVACDGRQAAAATIRKWNWQ